MAEDEGQEKSFEPSAKRRQDFLDKGQVPKSMEINSSLALAASAAVMVGWAPVIGAETQHIFGILFSSIPQSAEMTAQGAVELLVSLLGRIAIALVPPVFLLWLVNAAVGAAQQRLAFPKEPFKFNPDRLNPINAIKEKFFSARPFIELGKSLLKVLLIGWLVWSAMEERFGIIPALLGEEPGAVLVAFQEMVFLVLSRALPVALVIAVLDYTYEWYRLSEQMKMTKEEMKEEQKSTDGDPHIKSARRRRQMEMAMARTVANVRKADVVITNPTHYAVALRYRKEEAPAPVVVARGVDALALRIRAEARHHDIPQIENRALARALYHQVKEGRMIPEDLYKGVAKVLAVILKRRQRVAQA